LIRFKKSPFLLKKKSLRVKENFIYIQMAKGMYYYIKQAWKKPNILDLRKRMIDWRKGNAVVRVEKPLRLDRARALGYKDKKGFVVLRVKLLRGGRRASMQKKGRRSKRLTNRKVLKMNYREVAESRAAHKFPNLEVLNSYWIGQDGLYFFYEVIMVDPLAPEIKSDKNYSWLSNPANRGRIYRGLTSAGRKSRGLRNKGNRAIKIRPSLRAHNRLGR
jgi:large subunit ribosomal protein L15e